MGYKVPEDRDEQEELDMEEFMYEVEQEQDELQESLDKLQEELENEAKKAHEAAVNYMKSEPVSGYANIWEDNAKLYDEVKDYFSELDKAIKLFDTCLANMDPNGEVSVKNRNNTEKISDAEQKKYEDDLKKESDKIESDYEKELKEAERYLRNLKSSPNIYPGEEIFGEAFQQKVKEFEEQIENAKLDVKYPVLNEELNEKYDKASSEYNEAMKLQHENVTVYKEDAQRQLLEMQEAQKKLEEKKRQLVDERKNLYENNGKTETSETRAQFEKRQNELNKEQKEFNKKLGELNEKIKKQVNKYNKTYETEREKLKAKQDDAYNDAKREMKDLSFVYVDPTAGYQPFGNMGQKKYLAAGELSRIKGDMKTYYYNLFKPMRQKRDEISKTLGNINNLTERKWYGVKKKEPQAFTDATIAVAAYLRDTNDPDKAYKAYDECRYYLSTCMEADGKTLKKGSNVENARNKGILKILETMEQLPEFKKITNQKQTKKEFEGFEVIEKDSKRNFTKLSFKELEASLSKDSEKKNSKSKKKEPIKTKKEKTFKDLNRQFGKK